MLLVLWLARRFRSAHHALPEVVPKDQKVIQPVYFPLLAVRVLHRYQPVPIGVQGEMQMQSQMVVRVLRMGALLAGAALATVPALGQEEVDYRSEVSVQAMGSFLEKTSSDRVTQSATDSGGVLASYRFFFNKYNGVELNYGYTLNTQSYEFPVSSISAKTNSISVKTNSDEATAAYIVRYPHRVAPFALVGTGAVVFDPTNFIKNPSGAGTQARAVFLYGAGSDFRLSDHLFLRAEYHGLVYPSPNFGLPELAGVARLTHRAEPSIGFGARF